MKELLSNIFIRLQNKTIIPQAIKVINAWHLPYFWKICITNRYLIASLFLFVVMILHSLYSYWVGDFWEHSAVVKELSTHPLYPQHPLFIVNKAHHGFSPYLLFVGLLLAFPPLIVPVFKLDF